ncbi:hypothetical protein M0R36_10315 [bacterium]|jgi:hypothetical protein|nr:hypothetical protein [bacterium]
MAELHFTDLINIIKSNPKSILFIMDDIWYLCKEEPKWIDNATEMMEHLNDILLARSSDFKNCSLETLIEAFAFTNGISCKDIDDNDVTSMLYSEELDAITEKEIKELEMSEEFDKTVIYDNSDNKNEKFITVFQGKIEKDIEVEPTIMPEQYDEPVEKKVSTDILKVPKVTKPNKTIKIKIVVASESGEKKTV